MLSPGLQSAACSQTSAPAGPSSAEHSAWPDGRRRQSGFHDDPASPAPRACCFQLAALVWPPLGPDSELCGRCIPISFRSSSHIPFRCPQTAETGRSTEAALPRRREHGQFRSGYDAHACASGPTRSLAELTPPPMSVCPPVRTARSLRLAACPLSRAACGDNPSARPGRQNGAAPATRRRRCQTARFQFRLRCSVVRVWACSEIAQTVTALVLIGLTSAARVPLWAYRLAPVFPSKPRPAVPHGRQKSEWRGPSRAAADQPHCASGVARRDMNLKRFSCSPKLAGSLASSGADNKHCDAAKFSSDSSADSFPSGPFHRPFCSSLSPHNVPLSSPLKTGLSRRLTKTPWPPQPPRQARFAPAVPRPRAPLVQKECRRRGN